MFHFAVGTPYWATFKLGNLWHQSVQPGQSFSHFATPRHNAALASVPRTFALNHP